MSQSPNPFTKSIKQPFIGIINGVTITDKQEYEQLDAILNHLYSHYQHRLITNKHFIQAFYKAVANYNLVQTAFDHPNQIIIDIESLIQNQFEYSPFKEVRFCSHSSLKPFFDHVDELIETKA